MLYGGNLAGMLFMTSIRCAIAWLFQLQLRPSHPPRPSIHDLIVDDSSICSSPPPSCSTIATTHSVILNPSLSCLSRS